MSYVVYECVPKVIEDRKYYVPDGEPIAYTTSVEALDAAVRLLYADPPRSKPLNAYCVSAVDVFAKRGILR